MRWLVVLVLFVVACGGGETEEVLHFDGYDMTYRSFQLEMRGVLANAGPFVLLACKQFNDMSPQEAIDYMGRANNQTPRAGSTPAPTSTPPKSATPKPGQKGDERSKQRGVEALLSECKRLTGG